MARLPKEKLKKEKNNDDNKYSHHKVLTLNPQKRIPSRSSALHKCFPQTFQSSFITSPCGLQVSHDALVFHLCTSSRPSDKEQGDPEFLTSPFVYIFLWCSKGKRTPVKLFWISFCGRSPAEFLPTFLPFCSHLSAPVRSLSYASYSRVVCGKQPFSRIFSASTIL